MAILACFLLILIHHAASLSFNLTNISPVHKDMFGLEGGAYISSDGIEVTPKNKTGRFTGLVTYAERFHLWDKSSNALASFSTSFSFVKFSELSNLYRQDDGFIFFIAQNSSVSRGATQYVWVEFDPYCNAWENSTTCDHVAININSDNSVKNLKWYNISSGREIRVWVKYDSCSKNLSVSITGFQGNTSCLQDGLVHPVDLRDELPEWVVLGFSASTDTHIDQNTVKSWAFNSSKLQVDESNGFPHGLLVGLTVGLSVMIILLAILAFVLWRRKKNDGDIEHEVGSIVEMNHEFETGATRARRFSCRELARATAGFAEKEKLGEGSFGGVYKGFLKDLSTYIAVKRVSKTSKQGVKEYASEVTIISQLRHRNLVQLIGWCHEKEELLLVYEYMENGSLDSHLFKAKSLLIWKTRYKIIIDLASALLYLHEEWEYCVLHRDVKSSNVMLDSNFNAKLGDFGLAKLVDHEKGSQTTMLAGTLGYMAPECVTTGQASRESDVFSFGVVTLEVACGRKPIDYKEKEKKTWLPEWVWELYGVGSILEAVDPRLGLAFDEGELNRLMMVGLWCVHPNSKLRPSIRQVIQVLNSEAPLPILPLKMPLVEKNIIFWAILSSSGRYKNRPHSFRPEHLLGG